MKTKKPLGVENFGRWAAIVIFSGVACLSVASALFYLIIKAVCKF